MKLIWKLRPKSNLYMKKKKYSYPAIKVKHLRMRTYLMAGSTQATVPGISWAKYTNSAFIEEDEEYIDE